MKTYKSLAEFFYYEFDKKESQEEKIQFVKFMLLLSEKLGGMVRTSETELELNSGVFGKRTLCIFDDNSSLSYFISNNSSVPNILCWYK